MSVELGDDATYHVRGLGSISFQMNSSDVLEMRDALFVLGLKRNPLSILLWKICSIEFHLKDNIERLMIVS